MRRFGFAVFALLAAGCHPLWTVSSGPPSTKAELDHNVHDVYLTKGVALAIGCRDVWWGGPCENMTIVSDDPAVARVSFVHLDKYRSPTGYVYDQRAQRSVFVIAGVAVGRTQVRVGGEDADEVLDVIVSE